MELNGYELSRNWFDWCFENPEKINPNHTAMYFFIIEHCNRLGWKEKFGLPSQMTMDAIGISNYKTFAKTFADLIEWGFVKLIQKSQNQYSANIVALVKNTKAHTKALTKASLKHVQKQVQTIVDINKPINLLTIEPINQNQELSEMELARTIEFCSITLHRVYTPERLKELWKAFNIQNQVHFSEKDKIKHFRNWIKTTPYDGETKLGTSEARIKRAANW